MSAKPRILFVSHEMNPYLQISEIAQAALQLPKTMQERGMEIRVLMPRYGSINERKHRLHEVVRLSGINIVIGETDNPLIIKVASLPQARMQVYFLDNEDFFHRKHGNLLRVLNFRVPPYRHNQPFRLRSYILRTKHYARDYPAL